VARSNERELAVAHRVKEIRQRNRFSQAQFASALQITRSQLANIESGRTALRFDLANKICLVTDTSLRWLANKKPPETPWIKPSWPSLEAMSLNASVLLTEAFDRWLAQELDPLYDQILKRRLSSAPTTIGELVDPAKACLWLEGRSIRAVQTDQLHAQLNECLSLIEDKDFDLVRSELQMHLSELTERVKGGAVQSSGLTKVHGSVNMSDVKTMLPDLLSRLAGATASKGMKTKLAEDLGETLASVSQWLSGKRKPSGETTLRLLHWVEQWERNTKALPVVAHRQRRRPDEPRSSQ
jgi:transcriptional regulator with XRE-family HTH domain